MDSFHGFMRKLLVYVGWSWMFFYAYIAIAVFVLMNLVTAVIVEQAMTTSQRDQEHLAASKDAEKRKDLEELKDLFSMMDADGSGTLSWDEFQYSFLDPDICKKWKILDFQKEECKELFGLLDDGDGEIATGEFFDGLGRMRGFAQSRDVFRLQKCVYKLQSLVEDLLICQGANVVPAGVQQGSILRTESAAILSRALTKRSMASAGTMWNCRGSNDNLKSRGFRKGVKTKRM